MTDQECDIHKIIGDLTMLETKLENELKDIRTFKKATVDNNEQTSERRSEEKRSLCDRVIGIFKKAKTEASNYASESRRGKQNTDEDADFEIRKLQNDIRQMKAAFEKLTLFQRNMKINLNRDLPLEKLQAILNKKDSIKSRSQDLKETRRKVFNLKCEIPSLLNKQSSRWLSFTDSQTAEENDKINEDGQDIYLPSLHVSEDFKVSPAFEEILEKFEELDFNQKLCLLSFAVFPENREIKRTMLMYWWIGEEFISYADSEGFISYAKSENLVTRCLDEFSTKGLLEPVEDETKLKPNSYKMEPHVHSAVVHLAATVDIFKLYSSEESSKESSEGSTKGSSRGNSEGNSEGSTKGSWRGNSEGSTKGSSRGNSEGMLTMKRSSRGKVCLVKGSSLEREAKTSVMKPEGLETIFNSSERYPDFTFKWFRKMDSLRVLYLGRWEQTATRHIEVESTKSLKDIKYLKNLRLASFQGISRIEQLENYICQLSKLVILDLKACYNLERLPEDIFLLERLVYLDVSECYMLDGMPKGIADLSNLEVLKGFVISQSDDESKCAVKNLEKLRKLSITVNKRSFTVEKLMESLRDLKQLGSLKIAWGALFEETNQGGHSTEKKNKDLKERKDDQMQNKGQETKGDVEEKGASSKREDGRNEEANLEEGNKHDEVNAESLKSDKVVEGEKKKSPSQEATETIQNKSDDQKGKDKGDGDKGHADLEERKKQDEVEAEKSKSDKIVEGEKKASPAGESSDMIQKKPDDKSKVEKEGDGDKERADLDEGKKRDEVEAERSKTDKVVKGDEKTSPPHESKDKIQSKLDDKSKVEKEEDGDKEKADLDEGKKRDEVEAERSKSDKVVKGDEKTSPPHESKDKIQSKPDDKSKVEKEEDGDKGKAGPEEGKKHDEVGTESSKLDNVIKGDEKISPPQESKDKIQNKTTAKTKVEKEEDGDKGKAGPEEGKKHDEVGTESSKSDNVVDGDEKISPPQESKDTIENKITDKTKVEKEGDGAKGKANPEEGKKHDAANPSRESTDAIQNKPDDHQRGDKQEEKGDGEKEKVNLDEGKKTDEVKAESSKPDKVIEGKEKTSPPKDSIDTMQSKPDDHREISKVQEKGDGEKNMGDLKKLDGVEAKTQKSDKSTKFGKKVSFSENTEALIQKKPNDQKRDNAMGGESHETPSPSKESGLRIKRLLRTKTKKLFGQQETPAMDTSKFPFSLKKLELECFPEKEHPNWLNPENFIKLEKLSIKGGNLEKLSIKGGNLEKLSIKGGITDKLPTAENKWSVQILRLKYLHEFKVEWRDLKALFPKMILLEKYECPKIAFCPTDGNGVWRSQPQESPNM